MADENGNDSSNGGNVGTIESITGVVVDALFPDELPEIYSALEIDIPESDNRPAMSIVCEVQQHLGDDRVRTVAMDATDGLQRGDEIVRAGTDEPDADVRGRSVGGDDGARQAGGWRGSELQVDRSALVA